ncbi:MAG: hypothetical protein MUE51_09705 [Thermoleophilia bacterium]|jgi:hypothetical protein|nr:hypothetical protein [Thermoleophilia bacterium]
MPDPGPLHTARDRARPELMWFARHDAVLRRWPVLAEPWALRLEARRVEALRPRDITYLHGMR